MKTRRSKWSRMEARVVNLAKDEVLRLPSEFAPTVRWFYQLAYKWRAKMPGFSLSVWTDGADTVVLRTQ